MRFGGKVEYGVGLKLFEHAIHRFLIANVGNLKRVLAFNLFKRLNVTGIRQPIDHQHLTAFSAKMAHQRRADKTTSASNYATVILHLHIPTYPRFPVAFYLLRKTTICHAACRRNHKNSSRRNHTSGTHARE